MKKFTHNSELDNLLADLPQGERDELALLAQKLTNSSRSVAPSHLFRESSQKRVLAKIFAHRVPFWQDALEFFWTAKFPTAVTALILVFCVSTFSLVMRPYTSSARENAIIRNVNGTVWLTRGQNKLPAQEGEKVLAGDSVHTEENSKAEIQFADLSVSRLEEQTSVRIAEVANTKEEALTAPTKIELQDGKMWTQTQKTPDSPKFEVITPHGKVKAAQASFGVEVNAQATEVVVKENVAEVTTTDGTTEVEQKVSEDQKVTIASAGEGVAVAALDSEDNAWVAENTVADQNYANEVAAETTTIAKENAGTLPGDALYGVKQISEVARDTLTLDPNEKLKLKIELAKTRLAEAKTLLDKGETKAGLEGVRSFESALAQVKAEINQTQELPAEVKTLLAELEQDLLVVLPDSELYTAKISVRNLKSELNQADDLDKKMSYENQNLVEARKLVGKNDALVKSILWNYYLNTKALEENLLANNTSAEDLMRFVSQKNVEIVIIKNMQEATVDTKSKKELGEILTKMNEAIKLVLAKIDALNAQKPVVVETPAETSETILEEQAPAVETPVTETPAAQ